MSLGTPHVSIDRIAVGERFRKDLGDIKVLADSINECGLLHSIVIDANYNLIAGRRRLEACRSLGWENIPVRMISLKDPMRAQIEENVLRENFTVSEMVAVKRYYEPKIKAEADKRMKAGKIQPRGKFPQGKTRDIIARTLGVSGRHLEKAEDIVEAAEVDPETFGDILKRVDSGKTSISHAHTKINRRRKHIDPPALPEGIFDVIYADPPWPYYLPLRGAPDAHYKTMSIEDICNLEVDGVSIKKKIADNAILFLWATNPQLKIALRVIESWGFIYLTNMVWAKDRWGTGYYLRGKHELLLFAKRGDIPPPVEEVRPESILHAPVREHSRKPDEVYNIIETLYPNRQYLELFARNVREGWTSWGLETISLPQKEQIQIAEYLDSGVDLIDGGV